MKRHGPFYKVAKAIPDTLWKYAACFAAPTTGVGDGNGVR